jgi:hypothetical protein
MWAEGKPRSHAPRPQVEHSTIDLCTLCTRVKGLVVWDHGLFSPRPPRRSARQARRQGFTRWLRRVSGVPARL